MFMIAAICAALVAGFSVASAIGWVRSENAKADEQIDYFLKHHSAKP
jgi:hypothetical protein